MDCSVPILTHMLNFGNDLAGAVAPGPRYIKVE